MTGTKFGCGMGLCGACTIHIDGQPTRSCITPVSAAVGKQITTIEAIGATPAGKKIQRPGSPSTCRNAATANPGQIMSASALLAANPKPSDADIDDAMAGNICRCGTYLAHPRRDQAGRGRSTATLRPMPPPPRRSEMKAIDRTSTRRIVLAPQLPQAHGDRGDRRRLDCSASAVPHAARCATALTTDAPFAPNAFLRIDRAGKVTFVMPFIEMGQGTYTSIPMLIAEELEVDVDKVAIEHSPPDDKVYVNPLIGIQMTGGSTAIRGSTSRCGARAQRRASCW